eukprot:6482800-Amphidinium_carterae.5
MQSDAMYAEPERRHFRGKRLRRGRVSATAWGVWLTPRSVAGRIACCAQVSCVYSWCLRLLSVLIHGVVAFSPPYMQIAALGCSLMPGAWAAGPAVVWTMAAFAGGPIRYIIVLVQLGDWAHSDIYMRAVCSHAGERQRLHGGVESLLLLRLAHVVWMVAEQLGLEGDSGFGNPQVSRHLLLERAERYLVCNLGCVYPVGFTSSLECTDHVQVDGVRKQGHVL